VLAPLDEAIVDTGAAVVATVPANEGLQQDLG
jgi:hypothetical protein